MWPCLKSSSWSVSVLDDHDLKQDLEKIRQKYSILNEITLNFIVIVQVPDEISLMNLTFKIFRKNESQ